jgi:hypothetical protein
MEPNENQQEGGKQCEILAKRSEQRRRCLLQETEKLYSEINLRGVSTNKTITQFNCSSFFFAFSPVVSRRVLGSLLILGSEHFLPHCCCLFVYMMTW